MTEEELEAYDEEFEGGSEVGDPTEKKWFSMVQEEEVLIKKTGCNAMQVRYQMPLEMRSQYLSHESIMDKAMPYLEKLAKQRAGLDVGDGEEDSNE